MEDLKKEIVRRVSEPRILVMDAPRTGPWSNSSLKMLEKCPMFWFLEKVLKIQAPRDPSSQTSYLNALGKAAHYLLELRLSGSSKPRALRLVEEQYRLLLPDTWWIAFHDLIPNVESLLLRIHDFMRKVVVTDILVETKLAFTHDKKAVEFDDPRAFFRGIIDLTIMVADGRSIIIEHKTGVPARSSLVPFNRQLEGCSSLLLLGMNPEIKGVQPYLHHIKDGVVRKGRYLPRRTLTDRIIPELYHDVSDALARVRTEAVFDTRRAGNTLCQYCPYNNICKGRNSFLKREIVPLTGAFLHE